MRTWVDFLTLSLGDLEETNEEEKSFVAITVLQGVFVKITRL